MDASIRVKLWRVAADDVPHDEVTAAEWLLGWWRRIDAWILAHHGQQALPDAVESRSGPSRGTADDLGQGPDQG
jgi:hypothetical protein